MVPAVFSHVTRGNIRPTDLSRAEARLTRDMSPLARDLNGSAAAFERLLAVSDALKVTPDSIQAAGNNYTLATSILPAAARELTADVSRRSRADAYSAYVSLTNAARAARGEPLITPLSERNLQLLQQHVASKYSATTAALEIVSAALPTGVSFFSATAELHELCRRADRRFPAISPDNLEWLSKNHDVAAHSPVRFASIGKPVPSADRLPLADQQAIISSDDARLRIPRREEALFIHALKYFLTGAPLSDGRIIRTASDRGSEGVTLTDHGLATVFGERVTMFSRAFGLNRAA